MVVHLTTHSEEMNITEIFLTEELNDSGYFFYYGTDTEISLAKIAVDIMIILLGFPVNSYVIWLIVTGIGNGLTAELFSLNLCFCEILFYVECLLDSITFGVRDVWRAASLFSALVMTGRPLFQCLMCVERYLAVVHPLTFLKYKPLRYRSICCAAAWLDTFVSGGICVMTTFMSQTFFYNIFLVVNSFIFFCIQLFCLVAVLRALKQSRPGERTRVKEENHMKRRAFYLILITTVAMLLIIFSHLILMTLSKYHFETVTCVGFLIFALDGLVQPLLFLYRVHKLPFIECQYF